MQAVLRHVNVAELKKVVAIGGPMILVNVFSYAVKLISIMVVGRIRDGGVALASSSLATSILHMVGASVLTGMASALDTLCGQAHGRGRREVVGRHLRESVVVLNAAAAALLALMLAAAAGGTEKAAERVLAAGVAAGTARYLRFLAPSVFALATAQSYSRFLLAQGLVAPIALAGLATLCAHVPLCCSLVHRSRLGFAGAAVAATVSASLNALLLAAFVHLSAACKPCCKPPPFIAAAAARRRSSFLMIGIDFLRGLKPFLRLALPSAAMSCLEWWCYEILILLCAFLPNPVLQTSTLAVCLSITTILFQVPFGIAAGVSTRVSNELGARNVKSARDAMAAGLCLTLCITATIAILLLGLRHMAARFYTDVDQVVAYVSRLAPLLALCICFDGAQTILSGAARGIGLQRYGAMVNLISYYLVGLPIGCILAFRTALAGEGLWIAAVCAPFAQVMGLVILLYRVSWEKQAEELTASAASAAVCSNESA